MTKYCPVCLGEFKEKIDICPTDNVHLVEKKPENFEQLVDIYAASGEIEAERIISFLRDKGIDARESISNISQIPVVSDGHLLISVLREQAKYAKRNCAAGESRWRDF